MVRRALVQISMAASATDAIFTVQSSAPTSTISLSRLVEVLAHPEKYNLEPRVWFALNAPASLVASHPAHTLAARLGMHNQLERLQDMLREAFGANVRAHTIANKLNAIRSCERSMRSTPNSERLLVSKTSTMSLGIRKVSWIAFGETNLASSPSDQLAADSRLPQPSSASRTLQMIICHNQRNTRCNAEKQTDNGELPLPSSTPTAQPRSSLRELLLALGRQAPFCDASGEPLPDWLLDRSFHIGIDEMTDTSEGRRHLLRAASALVFHALDALTPAPLTTAAALAKAPKRDDTGKDPLRLAISAPNPPQGRKLLKFLAAQPMSQSLVTSYVSASRLQQKMAVKAQILAPFTSQYSLRMFNECFELELKECGGPVTSYSWKYAKWHAAIWLPGQCSLESQTKRWRLKGTGELNNLPPYQVVRAVEFLCSPENLQHVAHGTRRVRTSSGWQEFSATERTQCAEALWKLFESSCEKHQRVSRSHFLELAAMVAGSTQKSYGALDSRACRIPPN